MICTFVPQKPEARGPGELLTSLARSTLDEPLLLEGSHVTAPASRRQLERAKLNPELPSRYAQLHLPNIQQCSKLRKLVVDGQYSYISPLLDPSPINNAAEPASPLSTARPRKQSSPPNASQGWRPTFSPSDNSFYLVVQYAWGFER